MRRSFTLVEVLVAMTLGVLLLLAVQKLAIGAWQTSRTIERRQAAEALRRLPFELLRADLASLPADAGFALADGELAFVTLNALQFEGTAARHAVEVRYHVEQDGADRLRLLRSERELDAADEPTPSGVALATDLASASIEVFDGQAWQIRWPPPSGRTALGLRLHLTRRDGGQRAETIPLKPLQWKRHD